MLFEPVVDCNLHPGFETLRSSDAGKPARIMMEEIYADFEDPEGNFLQQFQTSGFDARIFELYLYAYFTRSGFEVDRTHPNPDFIVTRRGLTVAVEATTVNPSTSGALAGRKTISELSANELRDYMHNELPMRFGSALFSKLKKRYWDLAHCRDLPFVLAIEAFHDDNSLALSDSSLSRYVFGHDQTAIWSRDATGQKHTESVAQHATTTKVIPSYFFAQPDTEHISAVLFTNAGTTAKFGRMGYQQGYCNDTLVMKRSGYCLNPEPGSLDPTFFSYDLLDPPVVETWGQGIVVLHNPHCLRPIPRDFFVDVAQCYIEDGTFKTDAQGWHPFSSKTTTILVGETLSKLPALFRHSSAVAIGSITRDEFQAKTGFRLPQTAPIQEQGWFADETEAFLGTIVLDKTDDDWGYVILARDQYFQFRAVASECSLPTRDEARSALVRCMLEFRSSPQRIFPQDGAQEESEGSQ